MKLTVAPRPSFLSRLRRIPALEVLEERSAPTSFPGSAPQALPAGAGWPGRAYLDASLVAYPAPRTSRYNGAADADSGRPPAPAAGAGTPPLPRAVVSLMAHPVAQDVLAADGPFRDPLADGAGGGAPPAGAAAPAGGVTPPALASDAGLSPRVPDAAVVSASSPAPPAQAGGPALPPPVQAPLPPTASGPAANPGQQHQGGGAPQQPAGPHRLVARLPHRAPSAPAHLIAQPQPLTTGLVASPPSPAAPAAQAPAAPAAPQDPLQPIVVTGSDAGGPPLVKVFDATTGQEKFQFLAYAPSFTGGVRVAAADLNGDGIPDIITAPGPGMPAEVKVWDGKTGAQFPGPVGDFLAYAAAFTGGAFVAAGDVNGDGTPDVIVGPGTGGGSQVRAFSGKDGSPLFSFNAYGPGYETGVPVAAASWPGVGHAYVLAGSGPGSGEVRLLDPQTGAQVPGPDGDLHPYGSAYHGGVWVAAGDVNGGSTPDLITGPGLGHSPEVKVLSGQDGSVLQDFLAGNSSGQTGVRVASTYIDGGPGADLVTAGGPGSAPQVANYSGTTGQPLPPPEGGFLASNAAQRAGLFVAAAIDPYLTATISPAVQTEVVNAPVTVKVSWSTDLPNPSGGASYIDWGDGSPYTQFTPGSIPGSFTTSHAYAADGTFSIHASVEITSPGGLGGAASASGQATVTPPPKPVVPICQCSCSGNQSGGSILADTPELMGPANPEYSVAPVRYADGVVELGFTDLTSQGFGVPWGQARSWSNGGATPPAATTATAGSIPVPLTGIDVTFSLQTSRGKASSPSAGVPAEWEAACPTTSRSPTPGRPPPTPAPRRHPTARFRAASTSTVRPLRRLPLSQSPRRRAA